MKRRKFIGTGITGGLLPLLLNGFSIRAMADNPLLSFLGKAGNSDRVLVLIQLNGGNDGLNTVIPIDQYSNLTNARSNIIIAQNKILALSGNDKTGLHPGLAEVRGLYDNGRVAIIQSVGYPNPDFSHFRSTDIWLTASDTNQFLDEGWMGRYLDTKYPGYPTGFPNTTYPDPPAIQIGAMVSPALQGQDGSFGMSISDPTAFYQFVSGTVDPAPNTPAGHELTFIRLVTQQTQLYSTSVKNAAQKATNISTLYPAKGVNTLSDQLKIVAQLIAGGLKTKVYMVSLGGFDNHSAQVVSGATETGTHATLLSKISVAVNAFQDDLTKLGVAGRVMGMTFSEFGRRIKSNGSLGTDHGAAAPMFLFGEKVNGGIYGNNPTIAASVGVNDNIPMQNDFRSVYASIIKNWFEASSTELSTVMLKDFPILPFVNGATGLETLIALDQQSVTAYPNPCRDYTSIRFNTTGGLLRIRLFNSNGQCIQTIAEATYPRGQFEVMVNTTDLSSGLYYYQVQLGDEQVMKNFLVV
ncbi:MAG: DUF1501 domain-containing protein [Bacteroidia bacterium]|jgi:uncharacterized protein (DUF1501 family)